MTTALTSPSQTVDVFALPVLAAADVFPMMPDDELQELAADIKENGLHEPLVIADVQIEDGEIAEVLVDGRNRRAACKIAGIEPTVRRLNGEDPNAYVLSANILRRHMKLGQRAMAVAMIYPEAEVGRPKKGLEIKPFPINKGALSQARSVLSYSHPLAESVLSGIRPLDAAYKEAQAAKQESMGESARMDRLRAEAPDLADLVNDERMTLAEAAAAASARVEERTRKIDRAKEIAAKFWHETSSHLGAIKVGEELGIPYTLPDEHRQIAQSVAQRIAELLDRSSK